jgi:RimJ/RimL family protein N-acetyltransferase
VVHCIDPANTPSIKVAQRIGSRFLEVGRLPEPYQDVPVHLWGQTAEAWKARRASAGRAS